MAKTPWTELAKRWAGGEWDWIAAVEWNSVVGGEEAAEENQSCNQE